MCKYKALYLTMYSTHMFASSNWIHRKMFFISNSYLPTFFSCLSHLYLKCFLALGTNIFKYLCESFSFGNFKMIFVKLVGFLSASLDPKDFLSLNLYSSLPLVPLKFLFLFSKPSPDPMLTLLFTSSFCLTLGIWSAEKQRWILKIWGKGRN